MRLYLSFAACILLLTIGSSALAQSSPGEVKSFQKVSATTGGLGVPLGFDDHFGHAVAGLGDLDGDGVGDVAVGESQDDDGFFNAGAVWIIFLQADGKVKSRSKISQTAGGFVGPLSSSIGFGAALANVGDLDGDGVTELAVGAWRDDDGGLDRGAVWILFLNPNGTVKAEQKISSTAGGFTGTLKDSDWFGIAVGAMGDQDGDGVPDLASGARQDDDGGVNFGAVWVLFLNTNGTVKAQQKISTLQGGFTGTLATGDLFGNAVSGIGDVDGDGVNDLMVGAMEDDDGGPNRGAVYILFLNASGTVKSHQKISSLQGGFTAALANNVQFGAATGALTDFDFDGVPDILVGARLDGPASPGGAVYSIYLNPNGTVKGHQEISRGAGKFGAALAPGDEFGNTMTVLGDQDGDGAPDICVGAWLDDDGASGAGAIYNINLVSACSSAKAYGAGCPGSGGFVPKLTTPDCPAAGAVVNLTISDGLGGSPSLLFFGLSQAAIPMGGGSCTLNISPILQLIVPVPLGGAGPGTGSATLAGLIPAVAAGAKFTMQAFVADPGTADGFSNTAGLEFDLP